jgi:hypothetical protein
MWAYNVFFFNFKFMGILWLFKKFQEEIFLPHTQ